ncbi:MAG: cytochrome c3 family protein, partial [Pseudomonadota bacterium]
MKKQTLILTTLVAVFIIAQSFVHAAPGDGIKNSAHDFIGDPGWPANVSLCQPCHTPHFANTGMKVLWNHAMSNANYTTYKSPYSEKLNMQGTAEPGVSSKMCLSCHDGTVALDNYGGGSDGSSALKITGNANLGVDLSNDHPIGIKYGHNGPSNCANCHSNSAPKQLKFYEGKVECGSCHDPHNKGEGDKLLRIRRQASELCL